jgi:CheY-like chemotaxis protein
LGHELRNPLAPILTALDLMKIRDHGGALRERAVIERQVQHLVCLVDDLLDVSRITRGQIELKKAPVEIAQVIGQAVDMASPLLERRSHELQVAVPSRGLLVNADEERMVQIFANLLTNAAKYTDAGGHIGISAARDDGQIVIRVSDSGCGIRSEMLPHIFEMFVQGERTLDRSRGGLGLGLTIVRSLVDLHGGSVTVHSEGAGRGTEFVVTLPAVSQQVLDLPPVEPALDVLAARPCGRRVLVVDDNTDAAETLADILREHGHQTSIAHDGPTALTQALVFHPDVALLDIGLPVMDGYELARKFREQPELKRVQLLAVTGYGQQEDKERSRAAGFQEHLVKPIDFSRLRALIDRSPSPAA